MNVLYIVADSGGEYNSAIWRCNIPAMALHEAYGHDARLMSVHEWIRWEQPEVCDWADVIVLQRLFIGESLQPIEYWKSRGKLLIGDVDDAYHQIPKKVSTYRYWKEGYVPVKQLTGQVKEMRLSIPPVDMLKWGGKLCHAVSAPSELLLEDWSEWVDRTLFVPNYPDTTVYTQATRPINRHDGLVIGWGGGASHESSFRYTGIIPALLRILDDYPEVKLALAGGIKEIVPFFQARWKSPQIIVKPWTPYDQWPATLATFDIGLIPLHGPYDDYRSPIKAIEYALMGIPWVGTRSPALGPFKEYGLLVNNGKQAWYEALKDMIENHKEYREAQQPAFDLAMSLDINKNIESIVSSYLLLQESNQITKRMPVLD